MADVARRRFLTLSAASGGLAVLGASNAFAGVTDDAGVGSRAGTARRAFTASTSCVGDPAHPKRQLRGVWIATVADDNWPSAAGLPAAQQQAELVALLDAAVAMRMNAVYFQIRPCADAFYVSHFEPWSQYLTGTQGVDPGYDPLAFVIEQAHQRNLELHAWMNPYRVSLQPDVTQLVPWHPARQHPDWVVRYAGALYYNPGVPAVRDFDFAVVSDVVANYDVDGVHFDDYFYPYPVGTQQFDDDAAFARYGDGFTDRGDWRRHNINLLVSGLDEVIHAIKPWVKWGISPFGIWRNDSTDPLGSATNGLQSYDAIYADTRLWVRQEWIDYVAPQLYWPIGFAPAAYDVLTPWWSDVVTGTSTQLLIGQDAAKIGSTSPAGWTDPNQMPDHLILNRSYPRVAGDIFFGITQLLGNPLDFMTRLETDLYEYPALVPIMPSLGGVAPAPARLVDVRWTGSGNTNGVQLRWNGPHGGGWRAPEATSYAVYRFDGHVQAGECDFDDARNLLAVPRARRNDASMTWIDTTAMANTRYTYYVTSLDRLHHESDPSDPGTV